MNPPSGPFPSSVQRREIPQFTVTDDAACCRNGGDDGFGPGDRGLAYVQLASVRVSTASVTDDVFPAYRYASTAALDALEIRAAHIHFSAKQNGADLKAAAAAAADFGKNSDAFLKANVDQHLSGLWEAVLIGESTLEEDTKAFAKPGDPKILEKKSDADYATLAAALAAVRVDQQTRIELVTGRAITGATVASNTALTLALVGLIACAVISFVTLRSVIRPIERVADRLHEMSEGESDLRSRIQIATNDSLGRLANGFNGFVDNLSRIVRDTRKAAKSLIITSDRLVEAYRLVDDGLKSGATEMRRAKEAAETIASVADNVSRTEVRLANAIEGAGVAVTESASSMQSLSRTVAAVAADVDAVVAAFNEMTYSAARTDSATQKAAKKLTDSATISPSVQSCPPNITRNDITCIDLLRIRQ